MTGAAVPGRGRPVPAHPRPASRRGRAVVRRLAGAPGGDRPAHAVSASGAALTGGDDRPDDRGAAPPRHARPRRFRRPTAGRGLQRRRTTVLVAMGVLTVGGVMLATVGLSAVRNSTVGLYEQEITADDPGFQARVVTTPTMTVLHQGPDGALAGVALLALEPEDDGGSVVVIPPATVVPAATGGETTIAEVYVGEGAEAAADAAGSAVTVAVEEHVELDSAQLAQLLEPAGALELTLDRPVAEWSTGEVDIEPTDAGTFLAGDDDEPGLHRAERQQDFWEGWLGRVASAGDDALAGEVGTGLGRFVHGIARGGGSAAVLPVARQGGDGVPERFAVDGARIGEFVAHTVPYPRSPVAGARTRVRLLNGTGDGDLTTTAARALVAVGAEIVVVGNASSLDVTETSLVYSGAERAPLATALRDELGGGRLEEVSGRQDEGVASSDEIDVTVILGDDAEDLIGR